MRGSYDVPGKPKKQSNDGYVNIYMSYQILISIFLMLIGLFVSIYCVGMKVGESKDKIDYSYYEQFKEYLIEYSDAYDGCSDEFLIEEYKAWMNNTGYADIIIGIDGNLEDAFGGIDDIITTTDPAVLSHGVYTFSDDESTYTAIISMKDLSEGDIVLVKGGLSNSMIYSAKFSLISENKYLLHDSKDMTVEFTDHGTIIIEDGVDKTYVDNYTLPSGFIGEYLPIYSY